MNFLQLLQFHQLRFVVLLAGAVVFALGSEPAVSQISPWDMPSTAPSSDTVAIPHRPYAIATTDGVTISGENGRFVGQVLINGTRDAAWAALTDYNNFAAFLPNVESSRLLNRNGSQVTFEQVNVLRVAVLPVRNRVTIAASEQRPDQIRFTVTDGDDQVLQGVWQIQPTGSRQVLVTHQVAIVSQEAFQREIYSSVYRSELETTLVSLQQEIERRSR